MAATPGMWIGIRSIPTYGQNGGPAPAPIIRACATLAMQTKPVAILTQQPKPGAALTQRPC